MSCLEGFWTPDPSAGYSHSVRLRVVVFIASQSGVRADDVENEEYAILKIEME